ncbi:MAG: endonuclease/exonuclease/phosphatase family protein [Phycisphaerales bacterium]
MDTHTTFLARFALTLATTAGLATIAACSESETSVSAEPVSAPLDPASTEIALAEAAEALQSWSGDLTITMDGDVSDWPDDIAAVADAHWLYLRFSLGSQTQTLQGMPTPVAVWIDADGNPSTGRSVEEPKVEGGLGADIEVIFSPREPDARRPGAGVMFRVHTPDGSTRDISHEDLGFHFTPSHAAEWYEMRIARSVAAQLGISTDGLGTSGRIAGVVAMFDRDRQVRAWADPFEVMATQAASWEPSDVRIPARPDDALRVLSYNVEHSSPVKNPEPFARVIRVLDPDAILFQEWVEGDAEALKAWLTAYVDDQADWHVLKGSAWGVAVASKHPLTALTDMDTPNPMRSDRTLRFIGALAETPMGPLAVGSTHLKCCGTKDSREDRQRVAEASLIASMLTEALGQSPGAEAVSVVVGGDLNLVGSRPPLEAIGAGVDLDASSLTVAEAMLLGDNAMYTWYDAGNTYTPGRLDYLLYSDSVAEAANSFVLDTSKLSEAALARLGLDATDTAASDHLPVVLDVKPLR